MRLEKYEIEFNSTQTAFEFISKGPQGHILKRIEYSKIKNRNVKNLYNLELVDKNTETGETDDLIVTDNQDRDKVLATVASTVYIFTNRHPKASIIFSGTSTARNRLYRMAINKYFNELSETFIIFGFMDKKWLPFEKNMEFEAFLIRRKIKKI